MTTVLQYLVIAAVIGLLLFGIALLLFGRGEQLSALPARTSPVQLPEGRIDGADVRRVRFALALRGYRMSDVDWTLDRLADELDRTRQQLAQTTGTVTADQQDPSEDLLPTVPTGPSAADGSGSGAPHPYSAPHESAVPQQDAAPQDSTSLQREAVPQDNSSLQRDAVPHVTAASAGEAPVVVAPAAVGEIATSGAGAPDVRAERPTDDHSAVPFADALFPTDRPRSDRPVTPSRSEA